MPLLDPIDRMYQDLYDMEDKNTRIPYALWQQELHQSFERASQTGQIVSFKAVEFNPDIPSECQDQAKPLIASVNGTLQAQADIESFRAFMAY